MPILTRYLGLGLMFLALQACSLPRGAGMASQVLAGAEEPDANFAVEFVTRENLSRLLDWPKMSDPNVVGGWIDHRGGPVSSIIESGDVVTVALWSNEESTLLGAPGQKQIPIPPATVASDGTIFLPYVDKVYVAKMSPDEARQTIQEKLAVIIPSAQVQLSVESGRQNSIDIISGVARPGTFALEGRNVTILSMIAQAGGVTSTMKNPQVRLSRDGHLHGVSLARLLDNPSFDTTLRGGDKIFIEDEARYFLSLGAAGAETRVPFPSTSVSALEAMSLVGGANDATADLKGILILRDYARDDLRADGSGPSHERTIFVFDMTTADGLFSAGEFQMSHKDVLLVTESPVVSTRTALTLFGALVGTANTVQSLQE